MMQARNAGSGIRIRNSRGKKRKVFLTRTQLMLVLFLMLVFMSTGIGYVWCTFEKTQIGYDITQLKKEEMELAETNRKLLVERAYLRSPQRIADVATAELGMKQPTPAQVIVLQ
jgi:cell division protein FtsL